MAVFAICRRCGLQPWSVAVFAVAVPVFLASGCAGQPATRGETARGSYQVVRVVDGDTFIAEHDGKHRVRVLGIDTPETVEPNRPVECGGEAASKQARKLLDGQTVELATDATQGVMDKYGRMLAYVQLPDGRDFGKIMISGGYGREYTYNEPYTRHAAYRGAEQAARSTHKGLWGTCHD